ncbi:MAG: AsmA family protein [Candidatus Gastranaerophilales bacterium]|nr:AsmA family protein [Candidatus Gastranaerophilales bacterium]
MKNFFKITGIMLGSILVLLYLAFLIVPYFINLDNFKADIQQVVKNSTKLNLEYSKLKLYSTPLLSFGAIIEDLDITLDDNSTLFKTPRIKAGLALPSLFALTVKTSKCYIDNPQINLEVENGRQYKVVKIIEDIINEANAQKASMPEPAQQLPPLAQKIVDNIKIKVPSIKITNYNILTTDPKINHSLTLKGDELVLGYNSSSNTLRLKTIAQLLSDDNQNILADIKVSTVLPKPEASEEEADPDERIQIPFINLIEIYQTYDLKTNIVSRLKIRKANDLGYFAYGFLNVDNLNLKLGNIRLPDSFLHAKFHGKQIDYISDIYAKSDEKINLEGTFKFDKHPRMKANIVSNEIHFANLLDLSKALLDSLNIKNNLAQIQANGYLLANAQLKTNFKKLKSNGSILIKEGSFVNPLYNIGIKDIALNAVFDNDALNIKNSKATINGSQLNVEGYIDNQSNTDIKIDVDNLSLPALYNSFAPKELKKQYNLSSANLSAHIDIEGKLDELNTKIKTKLSNLALNDTKKTMYVLNKEANINLSANAQNIEGSVNNSNFQFNMPQIKTKTRIDSLSLKIDNQNVTINPFDFIYNNTSKINIKGIISDYQKNPNLDIFLKGDIKTSDIATTLGKEVAYYVPSKGIIPFKATLKGDDKKQEILAQIYADSANYISPVILNELANLPSLIQADIKIKGDKIRIKNSGLYRKQSSGFSDDLAQNMQNAKQIADFTTIIDGNHINLLRLSIPHELQGKIAIFKKSDFKTKGKITLNGNMNDLSYGGDLKITGLNIPELLLKVKNIDLDMISQGFNLKLDEIDINTSKINASLKGDLRPSKVFVVSDINVNSNHIDVDKAMVSMDKAMKYMPPASSSNASGNADIPLYATGKIDIKKLTTGAINIENIKSNLAIIKNELILNKLSTKAFKGDVSGDIKMHLISSLLTIKLKGKGIDADNMLVSAANMKDTLSGTAEFKTDITLKGATYEEQVKSLKGNVWFKMKNGVYGPFSKLENFFLAENIRENPVFKNTIGVILTPLTTIDSSHYETLAGNLNFNNGIVEMKPITSQGDILCVLIKGNMDLLKNTIDATVRVRLASVVSDLLGPLAMANPVNLIKNTPGLNIVTAKLFSVFSAVVTEEEYKQIPDFSSSHSDSNATKFQILLKGDVAKPLKLVKSFKWLALQKDMDKAKEFSDSFIKEQEEMAKQALINKLQQEYEADNKIKVGVEKVLKMDTTAPKVKELILEEVLKTKTQEEKQQLKEEAKKEITDMAEKKVQEVIDNKAQELQKKLQDKIQTKLQDTLQEKLQNKINIKDTAPSGTTVAEPVNAGDEEGGFKEG